MSKVFVVILMFAMPTPEGEVTVKTKLMDGQHDSFAKCSSALAHVANHERVRDHIIAGWCFPPDIAKNVMNSIKGQLL